MLPRLVALAATVVALSASPARAQSARRLALRVGETHALGGRALCDDPSVAVADGRGTLRALRPGKTICSVAAGGGRVFYEITVGGAEKANHR